MRQLSGVVAVRDEISLERRVIGDAEIAADIKAALARRGATAAIRVGVQDRIVTLHGLVLTYVERVEAEKAAWSAPGVREVVNKIVTTR